MSSRSTANLGPVRTLWCANCGRRHDYIGGLRWRKDWGRHEQPADFRCICRTPLQEQRPAKEYTPL